MVKNCFSCKKSENCVEYDNCDSGSLWQPIAENKTKKVCNTCKHFNYLRMKCLKTVYPKTVCVNKNYAEWEER